MALPGDGPTVARLRLGARLKAMRAGARITGERAAAAIGGSGSKISRIEAGRTPVREPDIAALLSLYGVTDPAARDELLALAAESAGTAWWDALADTLPSHMRHALELEAAASLIATYDCLAVPALLQTEGYAWAASHAGGAAAQWRGDQGMRTLARRRSLIVSRQQPNLPQLWAVLDETALRRNLGASVMEGQVTRLIAACGEPQITLQLVPASSTAPVAAAGPFTILRFPGPDLRDAVLLELLTTIDFTGKREDTDAYWEIFNQIAVNAMDPQETLARLRALADELRAAP